MKRRILSVLLACSLTVGLLAGCGSKDADDGKNKAESTENVDNTEREDSVAEDTKDGEEDEYLTINAGTLRDRELKDFFELYLRCWCNCAIGNEGTIPLNISTMLENTGIVGAFILDDGMRIVSDYDDSDFEGLSNTLSLSQLRATDFTSLTPEVSVQLHENNYSGANYKYKKGTDAVIQLIVTVTYTIKSGSEERSSTEDYAVGLVNNRSTPEEWLIREIRSAEKTSNMGNTVEFWRVRDEYGSWISNWLKEVINEDVEVVTEENDWYEILEAYKRYIPEVTQQYSFEFVYLNDDDIPDLLCTVDYQRRFYTILIYKDGEVYTYDVDAKYGFYYKERGNSICYGECDSGSPVMFKTTMHLMDLVDFELVETHTGECDEDYEKETVTYILDGVECQASDYEKYFGAFEGQDRGPADMKSGMENPCVTIDEAFEALNLE